MMVGGEGKTRSRSILSPVRRESFRRRRQVSLGQAGSPLFEEAQEQKRSKKGQCSSLEVQAIGDDD